MVFRKSKKAVKQGARDVDKLITGIIIGWAAVSIFGMSRSKKGKKVLSTTKNVSGNLLKDGITQFGKFTVKTLSLFEKNKK